MMILSVDFGVGVCIYAIVAWTVSEITRAIHDIRFTAIVDVNGEPVASPVDKKSAEKFPDIGLADIEEELPIFESEDGSASVAARAKLRPVFAEMVARVEAAGVNRSNRPSLIRGRR